MSRMSKVLYILAGISILSFAIVRFLVGFWIPFLWIPIGLSIVFALTPFYLDRTFFMELFAMKTTKNGMSMGFSILLVVILMIAINFIAIRNVKTFDFSQAKVNTLSDQSIKLLKSLDEDLKVYFFYQKAQEKAEENRRAFIDLIRKYQDQSSFVKLEFIEVNEQPGLVKEFGVDQGSGVVFFSYKGRKNKIDEITEQELTRALVQVIREKDRTVYVVTGHGEGLLDDQQSPIGLAALKNVLEGNRYQVKTLNFATTPQIPSDAEVLMIVGPNQKFLDFEIQEIEKYLQKGGRLLLALDPLTDHSLDSLLKKVGVQIENNFIVNVIPTAMGQTVDPAATLATEFSQEHPITNVFPKGSRLVMRMPMSLKLMDSKPADLVSNQLIQTPENSIGFSNPQFSSRLGEAPYTVAMSLNGTLPSDTGTDKDQKFHMIVIGDSDLLSNQFLYTNLNRDFLLNSMAYLVQEENLISITPKEVSKTEMNITGNQFMAFIFGFIIPLPILLLSFGGFLWFKRRHA